jgi:hypothetical protein
MALTVRGGSLGVLPSGTVEGAAGSLDPFLESLVALLGAAAVVVLPMRGGSETAGAAAIRAAGGVVLHLDEEGEDALETLPHGSTISVSGSTAGWGKVPKQRIAPFVRCLS